MQRNALIALALCWGCVRANSEDPLSNPGLVRDPINCRRSYRCGGLGRQYDCHLCINIDLMTVFKNWLVVTYVSHTDITKY